MDLPIIAATGAMSSGAYVEYMIDYLTTALDDVDTELDSYVANKTVTDWYYRWEEILADTTTRVSTLESNMSKIKAQLRMLKVVVDNL